ncbi:MAG: hypothetical protein Q4G45_08925 [Actinomycetia bacterium]|nr:hypothetical protein [Actinomycetes bacterium]
MRFDPSSWQRAAATFSDTSSAVGGVTPSQTSSSGGSTATDGAVSTMLSKLGPAVSQALSGLSSGMSSDATMMNQTAAAYGDTEQANVWASSGMRSA